MSKIKIAILGGGQLGTALAGVISKNINYKIYNLSLKKMIFKKFLILISSTLNLYNKRIKF